MAIDEEKEESKEAEAPAKKGGGKLIIIIAVVVVLIIGGVVGFLVLGGSKSPEGGEGGEAGEQHAAQEEHHYMTAKLEPFIVNLSQVNAFAKITILIEYDPAILEKAAGHKGGGGSGGGGEGAAEGGLPAIMQEREPMIRDAVIRVISSKKPEDVLSSEGKERLKEELIEAINESLELEEGPVVNIYFTEFIIQ